VNFQKTSPFVLFLFAAFLSALPFSEPAEAQTDSFYKGKNIRIVVGSTPGSFYDLWGRLLARHWGKQIPGSPEILVQNMPGAGSLTATNYVYAVAKPDGLSMVLPNNSIYIEQLVGRKEVQFDLRKFHWIGSASRDSIIFTCAPIRRINPSPISSKPNSRPAAAVPGPPAPIIWWQRFLS
jgi:tripartite-type tricarboxylate transporter receptor subunit TctC